MSPLHGLGHLIMDQSYVCALIAMMVRAPARPAKGWAFPWALTALRERIVA